MKKVLIFAIGLLIAGVAQAQTGGLKFGIKGGLNVSNMIKGDGNNDYKTNYIPGFNAGITLDIPIVSRLGIAPELVYSTKGYEATYTSLLGQQQTFTQTTNFIEAPILLRVGLSDKFNIVAGPQVSFLMSTKNKFNNGFSTTEEQKIEDESDRFKKSLFGGVIGFRYDLSSQLDIHGRYALDFQKNNENRTHETPEYKNQVFQVGLGIKF